MDVDRFHSGFGRGPGSGPQTSYKRFQEPKFQKFRYEIVERASLARPTSSVCQLIRGRLPRVFAKVSFPKVVLLVNF